MTNHRDVEVTMAEEELNAGYGEGRWKELPEKIVYKLEHHPASFEAVTYHIHTYAKDDNQTIVRAEGPVELWQKSIATPSLVASVLFAKYVNAVPLYRLETMFGQNDVRIIKAAQDYLNPLYDAVKEIMMKHHFRYFMKMERQHHKNHICGCIAQMRIQIVQKQFSTSTARQEVSAYHQLEKTNPEKFTIVGCWVHTKRKFSTVVKADGKKYNCTLAAEAVRKIQKIYPSGKSTLTDQLDQSGVNCRPFTIFSDWLCIC